MLTGLFVILVLAAIVFHYFFGETAPERGAASDLPLPRPISLGEAVGALPDRVFLQPTFTWARVRNNGEIFLGLHPMLTSLLGVDYTLELLADDSAVGKGDPLVRIRQGDRELQVFSPVKGQILEGNTDFAPLPGWRGYTMRGGSWVYRIQPQGVEGEVPFWLRGDEASAWAHRKYREIRDFLLQAESHGEVGLAPADGGELPAGVMSHLDGLVWTSFQTFFLPHPEGGMVE